MAEWKLDRDEFHRYLWKKAEHRRGHHIQIKKVALAESLGMNSDHLGRILKEMCDEGRVKVVGSDQSGVKTYEIFDPDNWSALEPGEKPPARQIAWG